MSAGARSSIFRVRIHYREPTFELYGGAAQKRARPFRWTYEIAAADAQEAKSLAVLEFERVSQNSGVGWRRQIVLIELPGGGE